MFDQLKSVQAVAGLLKNKDALRAAGERIKARAESVRATGQSGGGACRATVTGRMIVVDLSLDPALLAGMSVDEKTRELATGLIREAVNDALRNAQEQLRAVIAKEAEDLGMPGLSDQISGLLA